MCVLAVGFWSIYVCEYWIGIQTTHFAELWCWLNDYLFKLIALILVGFALLAHRPAPKVSRVLDVAAAVCIEVGFIFLTSLVGGGEACVALAASSAAEVGFIWLIVRWGARYVSVLLRQAFLAFLIGSLGVSVSKMLLVCLPATVSDVLMLLVVPVSGLLLVRGSDIRESGVLSDGFRAEEGLGPKFLGITGAGTVFFLGWSCAQCCLED